VGNQLRLYYDARSANHRKCKMYLQPATCIHNHSVFLLLQNIPHCSSHLRYIFLFNQKVLSVYIYFLAIVASFFLKAFYVPSYSYYICLCSLHHPYFVPFQYQFNLPLFPLYLSLYQQTQNLLTLSSVSLSALLITPFNAFTVSFISPLVMTFLYQARTFYLQCHSFCFYTTNSTLC
jgi:hypothetical protein